MTTGLPFHARFAGLDWSSDLPLDRFDPSPGPAAPAAIAVTRQVASRIAPPFRSFGRAHMGAGGVRFDCEEECSFDIRSGNAIGWVPGPDWRETLPVSFYSSVAAITLAMRGMLPVHASSVVLHGKAWLIAGDPGAGKSTLTAELLMAGAHLLADDLTPLTPGPAPLAWRGRPAMRLHPETCAEITLDAPAEPEDDPRGKLLARPSARAGDRGWPIGGLLLLGEPLGAQPGPEHRASAYGSILFRPRIITALPNRAAVREGLLGLARRVPMVLLPQVRQFDGDARAIRVGRALAVIERLAAATAQP